MAFLPAVPFRWNANGLLIASPCLSLLIEMGGFFWIIQINGESEKKRETRVLVSSFLPRDKTSADIGVGNG